VVNVRGRGDAKTYVTVYRRPVDPKKPAAGYKALFILMNENDFPIQLPLTIANPERVLGGANTLTKGHIRSQTEVPEALADLWTELSQRDQDALALRDIETGEVVAKASSPEESYGPVYVPMHDYRVLYGHWEPTEQ
jgi:hypothetical protein